MPRLTRRIGRLGASAAEAVDAQMSIVPKESLIGVCGTATRSSFATRSSHFGRGLSTMMRAKAQRARPGARMHELSKPNIR